MINPAAASIIPIGRYTDFKDQRSFGIDKYRNTRPGSSKCMGVYVIVPGRARKKASSCVITPRAVMANCIPVKRRKVGRIPSSISLGDFIFSS